MQITAPTHRIAAYSRDFSWQNIVRVHSHRHRRPLRLPWHFNLAATGLVALVIAACVLLQM